jgi:hypothetical protein
MKLLTKSLLIAATIIAGILSVSVFAAEEMPRTVKVYFSPVEIPTLVEDEVVFNLYDGETLLDTKSHSLKRGSGGFEIEFSVPEYVAGKKFRFSVREGAQAAHHNGTYSADHILQTYSMPDENGELCCYTSFYMDLIPYWNKEAVINLPGEEQTLFYHCLTEEEVYVTIDLLDRLGIKCEKHYDEEKPYFELYTDKEHRARFYMGDIYALFGYEGVNLALPSFEIDTMPYVPLSRVADYFKCNLVLEEDNIYQRRISLTPSEYVPKEEEKHVNGIDITSKTEYLIWVSKKDFKVNIFLGENKKWHLAESFPCSIGAAKSPTVEGQFEYYQYHPRWEYDKYYCGPVMRFYRGYAFHSYLIKYDGTPYDDRLGMKISAGCVRMKPSDIKWMVDFVPKNTKILITP